MPSRLATALSRPPPNARATVSSETKKLCCSGGLRRPGWPFGPLAQMLLLTGQRREEVGAMTWGEVNLETATWTWPASALKTSANMSSRCRGRRCAYCRTCRAFSGKKKFVFTTSGAGPVDGFSRAKNQIDAAMLAEARKGDPEATEIPH